MQNGRITDHIKLGGHRFVFFLPRNNHFGQFYTQDFTLKFKKISRGSQYSNPPPDDCEHENASTAPRNIYNNV
jgi:hypothetical protein